MKTGDFSKLGEVYRKFRVGYSEEILNLLLAHTKIKSKPNALFVDVGAGTGIWTKQIAKEGIPVLAVEPNDDMRENGKIFLKDFDVKFMKGTGEETGLDDNSADWISMASSFHWTDPKKSLPEFHRILKKGGFLTLIWNPLLKEGDEIQEKIESIIKEIVPEFSRGSRAKDDFDQQIKASGLFKNIIEIRTINYIERSVKDYVETWKAVNHLQAVAGPERFAKIISEIENLLEGKEMIRVPYLNKSWTAQKID